MPDLSCLIAFAFGQLFSY